MTKTSRKPMNGVIAVTGATGFIGSHLLSRLDAEQIPTRALIRQKRNRTPDVPSSTEIVSGSLQDHAAMVRLLTGAQRCVHLAGATTAVNVSGYHAANVIGTYNMAACAAAAGVEHFVYVSSQAARAPSLSNYAASKALGEDALDAFKAKMKITIIRPPAVIGAGDPMLQPLLDLIRKGWLPAPKDPKGVTRSVAIISADDLVSHIVDALRSDAAEPQCLEPCSVASTNWTEIASAASNVLGRKVRLVRIPSTLMKAAAICADAISKLTRRSFSLSQGKVRELLTVDWTYDHPVRDAMTLQEVFEACLNEDQNKDPIKPGKKIDR